MAPLGLTMPSGASGGGGAICAKLSALAKEGQVSVGGNELYIFARFHAQAGREGEVAEALAEEVPLARAEAGCLRIHAFHATRDPRLFFIHSCWRDEAAFDLHATLPHTTRFVERVSAAIDHPLDVARTRLVS